MFPILLKIGIFRIYSYGLLVALGFLAGAKILLIQARREKIPDNIIYDLVLYILISAIAGSRLLYIFFNLNEYLRHPLNILSLWRGGLVFQGGLIGVGLAVIVFCRIKHLDLRKMGDWIAPAAALGRVFGRMGCFLAGCCHGTPAKVPWAVVFNNPHSLAPEGVPIHPTQLYSSFGHLLIFVVIWKLKDKKHYPGQVGLPGQMFVVYLLLGSLLRFINEFFRGDHLPQAICGITVTQVIAVILCFVGIALHFYLKNMNTELRASES